MACDSKLPAVVEDVAQRLPGDLDVASGKGLHRLQAHEEGSVTSPVLECCALHSAKGAGGEVCRAAAPCGNTALNSRQRRSGQGCESYECSARDSVEAAHNSAVCITTARRSGRCHARSSLAATHSRLAPAVAAVHCAGHISRRRPGAFSDCHASSTHWIVHRGETNAGCSWRSSPGIGGTPQPVAASRGADGLAHTVQGASQVPWASCSHCGQDHLLGLLTDLCAARNLRQAAPPLYRLNPHLSSNVAHTTRSRIGPKTRTEGRPTRPQR